MFSNYKWFLIVLIIVMTLLYPGYVFGAIALLVLLIILILVVIDVVADIYIVVAMVMEKFKGK